MYSTNPYAIYAAFLFKKILANLKKMQERDKSKKSSVKTCVKNVASFDWTRLDCTQAVETITTGRVVRDVFSNTCNNMTVSVLLYNVCWRGGGGDGVTEEAGYNAGYLSCLTRRYILFGCHFRVKKYQNTLILSLWSSISDLIFLQYVHCTGARFSKNLMTNL